MLHVSLVINCSTLTWDAASEDHAGDCATAYGEWCCDYIFDRYPHAEVFFVCKRGSGPVVNVVASHDTGEGTGPLVAELEEVFNSSDFQTRIPQELQGW